MKVIRVVIRNVFAAIILMTCAMCSLKNVHPILDILKKVDTVDALSFQYKLSNETNKEAIFKSISPDDFPKIYQQDSLINKYSPENDKGYFIGKTVFESYTSLIIIRYYGDYLKTIETLNYNNEGKLIGFMFNSMYGGEDPFYNGTGTYNTNRDFLFEYEYEGEECYKQPVSYKISSEGQITKKLLPRISVACH